jgi:ecotin
MMACPPGMPPRDEFVRANLSVGADPADGLLRYNPKLPLVVYVPDGFELRYRVWRAAATAGNAVRE